jgi:hypothetical protein
MAALPPMTEPASKPAYSRLLSSLFDTSRRWRLLCFPQERDVLSGLAEDRRVKPADHELHRLDYLLILYT